MENVYDFDQARRAAREQAEGDQNPLCLLSYEELWVNPAKDEQWISRELELGPGRPSGLWGFGGCGKSYWAMAIAIATASGRTLAGRLTFERGPVVYLSHEMGKSVCIERARRLANGLLCEPDDLIDLRVGIYPRVKLNSRDSREVYLKEFRDAKLGIVDSFRRAIPGEDENDSTVCSHLDMLAEVSDRTACTFLYLHHTGKDHPRATAEGRTVDPRTSGRGSSAILDGSGSVWLMEGSDRESRSLTQIRAHEDGDGAREKIRVDLVQASMPERLFHTRRGPVRFDWVGDIPEDRRSPFERVKEDVLAVVSENPGITGAGVEARVSGKVTSVRQALSELEHEGRINGVYGPRNSRLYYPGRPAGTSGP